MQSIYFIDRQTGKQQSELVFSESWLWALYGDSPVGRFLGRPLVYILAKRHLLSAVFGWYQKQHCTARNIAPFVEKFGIDPSEFLQPTSDFHSFNEFFTRKLKPECRPIASVDAVIPADGRFFFHQNSSEKTEFAIKNHRLNLSQLLQNKALAARYRGGSLVLGRLCPTDYHRYHFPVTGRPSVSKRINGPLFSVNPVAIARRATILMENKRCYCEIESPEFGRVIYGEVGATNVGTICHTYSPGQAYQKGAEKGYFSFGGSALFLLFEPGRLQIDQDLLDATVQGLEMRCLLGQSLGKAII